MVIVLMKYGVDMLLTQQQYPAVVQHTIQLTKFKYLYPYLTRIGDNTFNYFEYPNDYVIYDDSDETKLAVTPGKWYNPSTGVSVMLDISCVYNNKYFVKYTITISKSAANKFNNGEYQLQGGLHMCSPPIFRTDDLTIK